MLRRASSCSLCAQAGGTFTGPWTKKQARRHNEAQSSRPASGSRSGTRGRRSPTPAKSEDCVGSARTIPWALRQFLHVAMYNQPRRLVRLLHLNAWRLGVVHMTNSMVVNGTRSVGAGVNRSPTFFRWNVLTGTRSKKRARHQCQPNDVIVRLARMTYTRCYLLITTRILCRRGHGHIEFLRVVVRRICLTHGAISNHLERTTAYHAS